MISFYLAGGLGMIRSSTDMTNTFGLQILTKFLPDQGLAIITQQLGSVLNLNIVHAGKLTSQLYHITEGTSIHG
jgi:hypothetical protein